MKKSIICISVVVTILLMASCTNNSETLLSEAKLILDSNSSEKSEIIKVVENMKIVLKEDPNSIIAINYLLNAYTQLDDQNSKMSYLNEEIEKRNKLLEIFNNNRFPLLFTLVLKIFVTFKILNEVTLLLFLFNYPLFANQ